VLTLHTTLDFGGSGLDDLFEVDIYNALLFGAAFAVLTRAAFVPEQRAAWLTMGTGMLCWSVGELYDTLFIEHTSAAAGGSVSLADAFNLAAYPCYYIALMLLARAHLRELRIGMWLDGLIAGLGAASVGAALILPPILHSATGDLSSVVVSLAYPIGDLLMMMFALGAIALTGWRPGAMWLLIASGMLVSAIADSTYLYQTATDSYQPGTWLECLWPSAAILLAIAAWTPLVPFQQRRMKSWQMTAVPTLALLSALGVLAYGNLGAQLTLPALILAAATVLAVGAHLIVTLRQNIALLAHSQRLSLTDPLTGLGNRRLLMGDLQRACKTAQTPEPWELVLYDLDGFKLYNDSFGHPAGDTLLIRLSERLKSAVEPHGTAYRMGGDEFCVLFDHSYASSERFVDWSVSALCEHGPGFSITASHGGVLIPVEVSDPDSIMQLADQRLYRRKEEAAARRADARLHMDAADALLGAANELGEGKLAPGSLSPSNLSPESLSPDNLSPRSLAPNGRLRSGDVYDGEHALPLGEHDGSSLAGTTPEQSASDRRIRRKPPL
jgi:two-component system cell cycle response regulator